MEPEKIKFNESNLFIFSENCSLQIWSTSVLIEQLLQL